MEKATIIDLDEYHTQPVIETFLPNLFSAGEPKHIPDKTLHERYWTSWEEQKLIELWRKYKDEIPTFDDHSPVFRTILDDMKKLGFHLTSRECRRRIITLRNKYFAEKKKLEAANNPNMHSKWSLYPLIDVVVRETNQHVNLNHEIEVVDELLTELNLAAPDYLKRRTHNIEETPEIFKNVDQPKTSRPMLNTSELRSIVPIRRVTPDMIRQMEKDIQGLEKNRDNELISLKQQQDEYSQWSTLFENTHRELERMLLMVNSRLPSN